jgi:uncharacterized protein YqgV (UPF0045/DUF77 family)
MLLSAQISIYPLGQHDLEPAIRAMVDALESAGLAYEVGSMSTLVWGEAPQLFAALQEGYAHATALGGAVLQITLSNACPLPGVPTEAVDG